MIHKFRLNGYNIVLDVNSGAVHVVDDLAFDILDVIDENMQPELSRHAIDILSQTYNISDILNAYEELYSLFTQGQLFAADSYQPYTSLLANAPIKSMCINIAHDCNLRCEYCFAAKGDFGTGRELMSLRTAKAAIDFIVEHSGNRRNLEVDFFGGEPLMNFDVLKMTVEYARSLEHLYNKNFRFTVTTNGLLLTSDKIAFINREMSNVVLSLDGRQNVNDKLRITSNGRGCYDLIVPKYKELVASRSGKDYYVRGTFTRHNLDFTADVLKIYELGFDQISIEPVVADSYLEYSIREPDLPRIFEEYEALAKEMVKRKKNGRCFNFFHFMLDLDQGPCVIKRLRGCSCGNEYIAVTPNGDIYPCHQFVGEDRWKMGNVLENTLDDTIKDKFAHTNVYTKEKCKGCWAKFFCSGGCNANNWQYAGDISKTHDISCELEKKRLECALMIKAATL